MGLSAYELTQCKEEVANLELRRKYMLSAVKVARERIHKLRDAGFYLEITFLNSQIIEKQLKLIISAYASRRRILEMKGQKDIHGRVPLEPKDEEPLGALIGIVKQLKVDPDLTRRLDEFNDLRREAVHHIFDDENKVSSFDKRAEEYLFKNISGPQSAEGGILYTKIAEETKKITDSVSKIIEMED